MRLKKAILRPLHKVRLDVDHTGQITPVMIRLEPEGEPIVISRIDHVDDRITEIWYEVETRCGDRLVLRLERERLRWELQTVESVNPDRYQGWFQAKHAPDKSEPPPAAPAPDA